MKTELGQLLGSDVETEILDYQPGPSEIDMSLFPLLSNILHDLDSSGLSIPILLTAVTDARFFSRLGIQTYGFTPMQLPRDMEFWRLTHGTDEHIPAQALEFGTKAVYELIQRFKKP